MSDAEPYDHYRLSGEQHREGIYRVVGTGDPVVLLQVGDAEGRRVNSGHVVEVSQQALADAERADNPDAGFRPMQLVDGLVEEVRMLVNWVR